MATAKHDWLNPLNKIRFHKAFVRRDTTINISDGRVFEADYDRKPGKILVREIDSAGNRKMVPMGWFDLKRVTDPYWIEDPNG